MMYDLQAKIILLTGWRRSLLAFLAGALLALGLAPLHLILVGFVSFPVLVWLIDGSISLNVGKTRRGMGPAFRIGWWFGFGYFLAGLWWISNALIVEAAQFVWFVPLAVLGLPALLAVFYGIACAAARYFWGEGLGRLALLALCLGLAEMVRGIVLTGFPWNAIGYLAAPSPLFMQSASVIGLEGLTPLAVLVFSLPAMFAVSRAKGALATLLMLALLGAHFGYGLVRTNQIENQAFNDAAPIIRIVQPSIDQTAKADPNSAQQSFDMLLDLSTQMADDGVLPDVIVWPETALPFVLTQSPDAVAAIAARLEPGQKLLTGAVRMEGELDDGTAEQDRRYYNSVILIGDDGVIIGAADKQHLVPFGEYLPFKSFLSSVGLKAVAAADRGYSSGTDTKPLEVVEGINWVAAICYEIIFSGALERPDQEVHAAVNLTNDGWFGNTPGPWQHLHQARLRAVEQGLPLIRVANTGISGVFDLAGRPLEPPMGYGVVGAQQMQLKLAMEPMPTLYSTHGLYYLWLLYGLLGFLAIVDFWRARRAS